VEVEVSMCMEHVSGGVGLGREGGTMGLVPVLRIPGDAARKS